MGLASDPFKSQGLAMYIFVVRALCNKKEISTLDPNRMFSLRGMKSNYCCVTVLKYSVFFDKNVYCVSLAKNKNKKQKKKKNPALWHLKFYKGFLVPNKCKDLIFY